MDVKVREVQNWLNETYLGKSWYTKLEPDGITGAGTCRALCKALQYEIGLTGIDGVIGAGTLSKCPTIDATTNNVNLVKIIQCGFYCKGYECGGITGTYGEFTSNAAAKFRSDAGFPNNDGKMPPLFIKALLNTDAFVLISNGKTYVREAQQYLNQHYIVKLPNWGLIPCNGVPDRNMMKAIIAALQYEEANQSTTGVDGIYGNNTLNKAPTLIQGTEKAAFVRIVQMCLMCMMETNAGFDGIFGGSLKSHIENFQDFYCLSNISAGTVDKTTWASLLSSKGNTSRSAKGCDTSTILDSSKAKSLYNAGYRYVGRYLTGTVSGTRSKAMTPSEIDHILGAGLRIFSIFQEGTVTREKFTYEQGRADAATALEAARALGIPYGEIIYFAIDYDMTDADVTNYVIKYFKGIRKTINDNYHRYKIGIYGSRNVCSRVAAAGYSVSSFVSDMSTGFSGNLGYKIPDNWAFDQFHEYTYSDSSGNSFGIDKVAFSGRYKGFDHIEVHQNDDPIPVPSDEILEDRCRELLKLLNISPALNFSLNHTYVIDTPIMSAEYTAACNASFTEDPDCIWTPALNISNGTYNSQIFTQAQEICSNVSTKYTAEFLNNGGISLSASLCHEITNGKVSVGLGVSNGHLMIIYSVEENLWSSGGVSYKLFLKVKIVFRNRPTPEAFDATLHGAVMGMEAALVVITIAYGFYLGLPILGDLLVEFITQYAH